MTDLELLIHTAEKFCKTLQNISDNELMFCENLTQIVQDTTFKMNLMRANLQELQ